MNKNCSTSSILRLLTIFVIAAALVAGFTPRAVAFAPDTYAPTSRLAEGRWVRVTVPESGLYILTNSDLRRYGFSNPASVRIYGYGGRRLSDRLELSQYTDDLPPVQAELTDRGLVFYAVGPETWERRVSSAYTHTLNPYSTTGSYFLTEETTEAPAIPSDGTAELSASAATTFIDRLFHEQELVSPGESGHLLVGEDLRFTRSRNLTFTLTDGVAGGPMSFIGTVVANASAAGKATIATEDVAATQSIGATPSTNYAMQAEIARTDKVPDNNQLRLTVSYEPGGSVTGAWLNAVDVSYERYIRLNGGKLLFRSDSRNVVLAGATADTRVWDVTDPRSTVRIETTAPTADGQTGWATPFGGIREYAAWNPGATLPSPTFAETVTNQNIHGCETPEMVIFTVADWRAQAERLADLHRLGADSLRVLVVDAQSVYNEFSSGTADINAFRRLLKMFYDRGSDDGRPLRYAMMMGRATHDNRQLTEAVRGLREQILPCWQTDEGLREYYSYMTDDFLGQLEDGAGVRVAADKMSIAVGRAPVGTVAEARGFVDKVAGYMAGSTKSGAWKNRAMIVADDGDNGVHLTQAESLARGFLASDGGENLTLSKIYVDAFDEIGGEAVDARRRMHREIDEGIMLWNYIGHGDRHSLTSEKLITINDATTMTNRNLPFFYSATCSFLRWDGIEKSGCENLLHNQRGGIVGAICPTREVYISENGYLTEAVGRYAFRRGADGRLPAVGEIIRLAKNDMRNSLGTQIAENDNKLKYVMMGDPALRLSMPDPVVRILTIAGETPDQENQVTIAARQSVEVTGVVCDPSGRELTDFDGSVTLSLYDAEETVTTQGRPSDGTEGKVLNFEQQGGLLYTGCDSVRNGRFTLRIAMPSEVADNFRPAALSAYARATDGREAVGVNRDFYVYGYDESAEADTIPPTIEYAWLNHQSFNPGDIVNPSPMFIASVSDNVGINLSTAGIGHSLLLKIDGSDSYSDLSAYYTPSADGTPGGTIAYPLSDLAEGTHSLMFRVWDTSGNSSTRTLDFGVSGSVAPTLYEVYTDANPASVEANFYLSHNRPDAMLTVTVEVFNMLGRLQWSSTVTDRSDMFLSAPLTWDLTDQAGHRVPRGIYLYRATVTCDGQTSSSVSRRIAVTGR
ncbi:MAG: type IX secretion system sortase PorU [Clostridium sp.]|nr:type IX secretion system sortase PorU [Clostridium sp.]